MITQGASLEAAISAVSHTQAWSKASQITREVYIHEISLMQRRARYSKNKGPVGTLQLVAGETKPTANKILSAHIVEGSFIDLYHWTNDKIRECWNEIDSDKTPLILLRVASYTELDKEADRTRTKKKAAKKQQHQRPEDKVR